MSVVKLASVVAKREGKKHQASVGDVRETIKVLADVLAEEMVATPLGIGGRPLKKEFETLVQKKMDKLYDKMEKAAEKKLKKKVVKSA